MGSSKITQYRLRNIIQNCIKKINESDLDEFRLKRDTLEPDMDLANFIIEDISSLVEAEIENGLYGMFNY